MIGKEKKTHPSIHEDKVHLHEGEDHLQYRIDTLEDLVAR